MKSAGRMIPLLLMALITSVRAEAVERVTNGNFSAGNSGFTSGYSYVVGGSTSPGQYGIVSNPATGFTNGYASYGDHTSGTGLMLLADGTPGLAVWTQTVSVAPNTTYSFSAWLCAPINSFPPIVRFLANNVALGPDVNVSSTPGAWQQFTAVYNSGPSTSVVLRIEDVRTGAPTGNDLTIDDISLQDGVVVPVPIAQPVVLGGVQLLLVALGALVMRRRRSS